eukprot:6132936-Prymnesium_polylepis.1
MRSTGNFIITAVYDFPALQIPGGESDSTCLGEFKALGPCVWNTFLLATGSWSTWSAVCSLTCVWSCGPPPRRRPRSRWRHRRRRAGLALERSHTP